MPPDSERPVDFPPSKKTRVRRLHRRARYDRESAYAILDSGVLCHVGYVIDGQPYVTRPPIGARTTGSTGTAPRPAGCCAG